MSDVEKEDLVTPVAWREGHKILGDRGKTVKL